MMEFIDKSQRVMKDEEFVLVYDGDLEEKKSFIAQGRAETTNEIVKNMYDQGFLIETISKVIKKSVKNVQKILELS